MRRLGGGDGLRLRLDDSLRFGADAGFDRDAGFGDGENENISGDFGEPENEYHCGDGAADFDGAADG